MTKTIFEYEDSPRGRGTEDYSQLAEEFLERVQRFEQAASTSKAVHA